MRFLLSTILGLAAAAASASVGSYVASEEPIAKANLLANIGDQGSRAPGAFVSPRIPHTPGSQH